MRIFVNGTLKEIACPVRKNANRDKDISNELNHNGELSNGVKKPRKLATAEGLTPTPKSLVRGLTVETLLDTLKLNSGTIAVELNLEVIPKKEYATKYLKEGDKIEIISFVGGG